MRYDSSIIYDEWITKEDYQSVIEKIWNAANDVLLIIEPGTPRGFFYIKQIRDILLQKGAHIIAPCPHDNICQINENDWCQFTCRVQRSKVHKALKSGESPYEDEKFSYIAVSKHNVNVPECRILRHPIINKGYSEFKICTKDEIKNIKLSKKNGELYKQAKKKSSGDSLNF